MLFPMVTLNPAGMFHKHLQEDERRQEQDTNPSLDSWRRQASQPKNAISKPFA